MAIVNHSARMTALSNNTNLYESVPLPLESNDTIRLLEVVSDIEDRPISCKLHSARLNDPDLSYTALSYMWGEEDASDVISFNRIHFHIRPDLWGFLLQL